MKPRLKSIGSALWLAAISVQLLIAAPAAAQHAPLEPPRVSGPTLPNASARHADARTLGSGSGALINAHWLGTTPSVHVDPPDVHGATGPKGILEINNYRVAYRLKAGETLWNAGRLYNFFPHPPSGVMVDPKAIYDPASGRFFAICIQAHYGGDNAALSGRLHVAVSKSSHPVSDTAADWYFFELDVTETIAGERFGPDYPCLGFDGAAVYVTANMFRMPFDGSESFQNCQIVTLDKSALIAGTIVSRTIYAPDASAFTLQPVTPVGPTNPGNRAYFVEVPSDGLETRIRLWALDDPLDAAVLQDTLLDVSAHGGSSGNAPQCGTGNLLNTLLRRAQGNAFWNSGELWFCHTGESSSESAVFYHVISTQGFPAGTATVVESGSFDGGPGVWTHQPAIGGNAQGDVCLVYTQSGPSLCPQIMVAARSSTAAGFDAPLVLKSSNYFWPLKPPRSFALWGDYGVVAADPIDGSFWASHEWVDSLTVQVWRTYWGNIVVPSEISGWPATNRLVSGTLTPVSSPRIVAAGFGGSIWVWSDTRSESSGIRALKLNADGTRADGWRYNGTLVFANEGPAATALHAVTDGAGGAFICMASGAGLRVQRLAPSGAAAAGWPDNGVLLAPSAASPQLAVDGFGGAVITWISGGVKAQRVAPNGSMMWGAGVTVASSGSVPQVVADGWGGALVVYGSAGVKARRIASDGMLMWLGPVTLGAGALPRIVSDAVGGALVAFTRPGSDGTSDLYAHHVNADGVIASGWPAGGLAIAAFDGAQDEHVVVGDGDGGMVIAWSDARLHPVEDDRDIYVQRVSGAGVVPYPWSAGGVAACVADGSQQAPSLAADGTGGAVVVWRDRRATLGCSDWCGDDIYGTRVNGAARFDSAFAVDGSPWTTADATQAAPIVAIVAPGIAVAGWEDSRHSPDCDPYCTTSIYLDRKVFETVAVPDRAQATTLDLAPPHPNPATTHASFTFTIPAGHAGAPLTFSIFDVAGRKARTLVKRTAEPGVWTATWQLDSDHGKRVRSGLYFARLAVGSRSSVRAVVVP